MILLNFKKQIKELINFAICHGGVQYAAKRILPIKKYVTPDIWTLSNIRTIGKQKIYSGAILNTHRSTVAEDGDAADVAL